MSSFYAVISFLLPSINGRWPRFISQRGSSTGLYDVRSRCHTAQQAGDEIIKRPNELEEDLPYAQLPLDNISCCCVPFNFKHFPPSIVYASGMSAGMCLALKAFLSENALSVHVVRGAKLRRQTCSLIIQRQVCVLTSHLRNAFAIAEVQ